MFEVGEPRQGSSTKNGGQISTSIKTTLEKLSAKFSNKNAISTRREGENALNWIEGFIVSNQSNCDRYVQSHLLLLYIS